MKIFHKKTATLQLEAELASLRARASLLDRKRAAAQAAFDSAAAARQAHLLKGDIEDSETGTRLQYAVNSASSALTALADATDAQAVLLADAEARLTTERGCA